MFAAAAMQAADAALSGDKSTPSIAKTAAYRTAHDKRSIHRQKIASRNLRQRR
jgi:hypothetical protein